MIIKIQVRDEDGKYRNAAAREFSDAALNQIGEMSPDAWRWMRVQLCRYCILRAEKFADDPVIADRCFARYQVIRGIE